MKFLIKLLLCSIFSILIISCSGNREQELAKLDKIWGYCDNPMRDIHNMEYTICKDKEKALGPDGKGDEIRPFSLTGLIDRVNNGDNASGYTKPLVNPYLWQGSLDITNKYELQIADSNGGYIQTAWIYDQNISDQRCMIKIQILSPELLSNAVKSNFICEQKNLDVWASDKQNYLDEEKQLNLTILEKAQSYAKLNIL